MRAPLAAVAILVAIPMLATASSVLLIGVPPELVDCASTNRVTATAFAAAWSPKCVDLISGDAITWHAATDGIPHAVDARAVVNLPGGETCLATSIFEGTQTARVRFTYDSSLKIVASEWLGDHFGPAKDCSSQMDRAQSTTTRGVLQYICRLHPNMRGAIVVHSVGGVG